MIKPRSAKKKKSLYYIPLSSEDYGFRWGPALVSMLHADITDGSITIGVASVVSDNAIQVRVTRTGKIRIYNVKAT